MDTWLLRMLNAPIVKNGIPPHPPTTNAKNAKKQLL
jgi:hypothetical protein